MGGIREDLNEIKILFDTEIGKISIRLDKLEHEPVDSYKYYKHAIIGAIITGIIAFLMGRFLQF